MLLMDMKAQMQVLAHHQQQILVQMSKNGNFGGKLMSKLLDGIILPLQAMDQLLTVQKKTLSRSQDDKQMLV